MKIAIIDDGIGKDTVGVNVERYCVENGRIKAASEDDSSPISHGSICAKIIEKYTDSSDISFLDIRILDEHDKGDSKDLIVALNFCYEQKIKIINMSCGFPCSTDAIALASVCGKLYRAGTVMVAASNNDCNLTYPACLSTVISVEQVIFKNENYLKRYYISDIYTYGEHILKHGEKEFYSREGNSTSCAYACAIISNRLLNNGNLNLLDLNNNCMKIPLYRGVYDFSDLLDVVLLADDEQSQKQMCFNYTKYPGDKYPNHINLVIISSKAVSKKKIMDCLSVIGDNIDRIIWCGNAIPHYLKAFCKRNAVRYWDETVDKSLFNAPDADVPVIQFFGDEALVLKAVPELTGIFKENMYNVLAVSDIENAYLYGFTKAYVETNLNLYAEHFQPDLIFLYMKNINTTAEDIIKITCIQSGFEVDSKQLSDSHDLYNYIVDVFGE